MLASGEAGAPRPGAVGAGIDLMAASATRFTVYHTDRGRQWSEPQSTDELSGDRRGLRARSGYRPVPTHGTKYHDVHTRHTRHGTYYSLHNCVVQ